jgi:aminoglycoside 6'-N-acetyltransferase
VAPARYTFRPLVQDDLGLVKSWFAEEHVARWWRDGPVDPLEEVVAAMSEPSTEPLIVAFEGEPFAYLQCYDPHMEEGHPYRDQPRGTLGLDLFVGPAGMVGRGHGSALLDAYATGLFSRGVPRLIIDPNPDNACALRAYRKAGFRPLEERDTIFGLVLLMARDPS